MCENMDVDVLVPFLKCVQFLKFCVQFLVDTILNLAIVQFLMKKKRDAPTQRASHICGEGRRNGRLMSDEKGDVPMQRASRISGTCVSLLFNMDKKECLQNIIE
jgi:hypothetical protein